MVLREVVDELDTYNSIVNRQDNGRTKMIVSIQDNTRTMMKQLCVYNIYLYIHKIYIDINNMIPNY